MLWRIDQSDASPLRATALPAPAQDLVEDADAVNAIAVLPERGILATGHLDGTLGLWTMDLDNRTIAPSARFDLSDTRLQHLSIAEDGETVLIGHRQIVTSGRNLHLCPLTASRASDCRKLVGHEYGPVALHYDQTQDRFMSVASPGNNVRSWEPRLAQTELARGRFVGKEAYQLVPLETGDHLLAMSDGESETRMILRSDGIHLEPSAQDKDGPWARLEPLGASPDGRYVLVASSDRRRIMLVGPNGEEKSLQSLPDGRVLAIDPTGRFLATVTDENRMLNLNLIGSSTTLVTSEFTSHVDHLVFSEDGETVVIATDDGDVRLLRSDDASRWQVFDLAQQIGDIRGLALSPDGTRLIAAGYEAVSWIWDLRYPSRVPKSHDLEYQVRQLAFSPTGRFAAGGTTSGTILLWDFEQPGWWDESLTDEIFQRLPWAPWAAPDPIELLGHDGDIADIAFSADGRFLLSASFSWASSDNTLRLWPLTSSSTGQYGEVLVRQEGWFEDVAISASGDIAYASDLDGRILTIPLAPEMVAALARRFAGRNLSVQEKLDYFTVEEQERLKEIFSE